MTYKAKYAAAPEQVKKVADEMKRLRKLDSASLRRAADQARRVHCARSKDECVSLIINSTFSRKQLEAHDVYFFGE